MGKWCCPGIGDDTANAAILLLLIKYVHEKVKKGPVVSGLYLMWGKKDLEILQEAVN